MSNMKRKKSGKHNVETVDNETWESMKSFQTSKIEQTQGINAQIVIIRSHLNKLTDKNYLDIRLKIFEVLKRSAGSLCNIFLRTDEFIR